MRRWGEAGVTLPEVLVAMLLIGIALVPLLQLYPSTIDAGRASEVNTILSAAAVRKMEENISILRASSGGGGAVTFDASVTRGSSGSETSTSASMTIAGSANYVVVLICGFSDIAVTSITVGGTATSFLLGRTDASIIYRCELWRLQNPPTGAVTVAVTLASPNKHAWVAASFKDVSAATPLGGNDSNESTSSTPNVTISPRAPSSMIVGGFRWPVLKDTPTITQVGGQTEIGTVMTSNPSWKTLTHLARETNPGDTGTVMDWIVSNTQAWIGLAVELRGGSGGVANPNGNAVCTDVPNCLLVWTTTDELSSATTGVGRLVQANVVACRDTNASTTCDDGEPQVRYDTKVTTRP